MYFWQFKTWHVNTYIVMFMSTRLEKIHVAKTNWEVDALMLKSQAGFLLPIVILETSPKVLPGQNFRETERR